MGWFSLFLFSDISSLFYRNTTDFCLLILYPATLLNSYISSNSVLVELLGFSIYKFMSLTNRDSFISSSLIRCLFFLFALARTSSSMLNWSGETRHHCPVPGLRGKAFGLSLLSMWSSCGLVIYDFYYVEVCSFYTQFLRVFIMKDVGFC